MKLRWIIREIKVPIQSYSPRRIQTQWEITTNTFTGSKVGKWIDVPLEVEE